MRRKEKIVFVICVSLVGILFLGCVKKVEGVEPLPGYNVTLSTTSKVKFTSNNSEMSFGEISMQNRQNSKILQRQYAAFGKPFMGNYHVSKGKTNLSSMQNSGARMLYSTASVSPHSYGGGGYTINSGFQSSQVVGNRGIADVTSCYSLNNLHTFVAMSSQVRETAEDFEYGENAIGADGPNAVRRRTPGSGPIDEDPEHKPTIVASTPIGKGLYFMTILAICYVFRIFNRRRREAEKF